MRYWIKLYTEILKDPKMGRLSDRQFRTCINLFALAGEVDQDGILPSVIDMSWTLRMDETVLIDDLQELAKVGIVRCADGAWLVCKWQERQAKAPSAAPDKVLQRVHEHRQRQRNETVTTLHNEVKRGVTPPETETETEVETDTYTDTSSEDIEKTKTESNASSSSYAAQMTSYHNLIGFVSGKQQSDEIFAMLDDLAGQSVLDWWEMALKVSADNNKRSWAYVRSVLTNCLREGHPPLIRAPSGNGSKPSTEPKYRYVEAGIGPDGKPVMRKVPIQ